MAVTPTSKVKPGTVIAVRPRTVDGPRRLAEVLEVLGSDEHRRYHVRWDDGHESIFFPGEDSSVEPVRPHARRTPRHD